MNKLILDTQTNVADKEEATKEKQKLVKQIAHHYHVDRDIIYAYADYLHYKGMAWASTPLELNKEETFKDKISPAFIKLLKIINNLRAVDDLQLLNEYLEAMKANGVEIKIAPANQLFEKEFLNDTLKLIDEQQNIICSNADEIKAIGYTAEEEQFCSRSKFKGLTESYYKINNSEKADKVKDKLTKEISTNVMNNSSIQSILEDK